MIEGFNFLNSLPTFIQFNGFTELMHTFILIFIGAGSDEYCVVPGNKKSGYCKEKV